MDESAHAVYTRDGRDGFPPERLFIEELDRYLNSLNPAKRQKTILNMYVPLSSPVRPVRPVDLTVLTTAGRCMTRSAPSSAPPPTPTWVPPSFATGRAKCSVWKMVLSSMTAGPVRLRSILRRP
jgi:hypothetical protein